MFLARCSWLQCTSLGSFSRRFAFGSSTFGVDLWDVSWDPCGRDANSRLSLGDRNTPCHLPEVIHLAPWISDDAEALISYKEAGHLLDIVSGLNDIVCLGMTIVRVCGPASGADVLNQASQVKSLQSAVQDFRPMLQATKAALAHCPLRRSWAMITQWTENLGVLADTAMANIIVAHKDVLLATAQDCDASCPRWGSFMTDSEISMDMARLQLVENKAIFALPAKVRRCAEQMGTLKALGDIANLSVEAHCLTRDVIRISQSSFEFGRRTMNVAAATRVLFEVPDVAAKSLPIVLRFRASLPAALAAKLDALSGGGGSDASSAGVQKQAGKRRKPDSETGASDSAGVGAGSAELSAPEAKRSRGL